MLGHRVIESLSYCDTVGQPMKKDTKLPTQAIRATKERLVDRELLYAGILSRLWPSHIAPALKPQQNIKWIVCVHSPAGQLAWRVTDDELPLFEHLKPTENDGQGYSFEDKMARLLLLASEGWK